LLNLLLFMFKCCTIVSRKVRNDKQSRGIWKFSSASGNLRVRMELWIIEFNSEHALEQELLNKCLLLLFS
jgi:hypothetical protein